jgi:hypothetical protein
MKDFTPEEASARASIREHEVFKVVNSRRCSCLSLGCYSVQYRVGTFVRAPQGTKFFVFDSLEHADAFMRLDPDLRIWRATARGLSTADRTVCEPRERESILRTFGEFTMAVAPTVSWKAAEHHRAHCGRTRSGWMSVFNPKNYRGTRARREIGSVQSRGF